MNQSIPLKAKVRDTAIGFFGWVIISNLVFLLLSYVEGPTNPNISYKHNIVIVWLLALTITIVCKKRIWVCAGIVITFVATIIFWIIFLNSRGLLEIMTPSWIIDMGLPLPVGFLFILTD
jgi:hypothetical protein